jgi:hypothetical protein
VVAVRSADRPPYVTYRVSYRGSGATLRCTDGRLSAGFDGGSATASYRVSFRARDSAAVSVETTSGVACNGVPLVDPTGGDIGRLVDPAVRAPSSPLAAEPSAATGVRVVGALHYRIASVHLEPVDGVDAYHLRLHAIADDARYPLTDLWIDPATYGIRRVRGSFSDTYGGAPATIVGTGDFRRFGSSWLMVHEHVEFAASTEPRATGATLDADASAFAFPATDPVGPV